MSICWKDKIGVRSKDTETIVLQVVLFLQGILLATGTSFLVLNRQGTIIIQSMQVLTKSTQRLPSTVYHQHYLFLVFQLKAAFYSIDWTDIIVT